MFRRWFNMGQDNDRRCIGFYCKPFTTILTIPPAWRVAQNSLFAWRTNRPTLLSRAPNSGHLSRGSTMIPRWLKIPPRRLKMSPRRLVDMDQDGRSEMHRLLLQTFYKHSHSSSRVEGSPERIVRLEKQPSYIIEQGAQ